MQSNWLIHQADSLRTTKLLQETKNCNGIFKPLFFSLTQNCSIFETTSMTRTKYKSTTCRILPKYYVSFPYKRNVPRKVGKD